MHNREEILPVIERLMAENNTDVSFASDIETLFIDLDNEIGLNFELVDVGDGFIEYRYFSKKINKGIIWHGEVLFPEDASQMADFIIATEKGIVEFEAKLPQL